MRVLTITAACLLLPWARPFMIYPSSPLYKPQYQRTQQPSLQQARPLSTSDASPSPPSMSPSPLLLDPPPPPPISPMLILLTVPLAWGTYTPVVKQLFSYDPPVPALLFSSSYYLVAYVALSVVSLVASSSSSSSNPQKPKPPTGPALELATYLFLANLLQLAGLLSTTATRAAFTVQLTTVTVPLLDSFKVGRRPSPKVWASCLLALSGLFLMSLDGAEASALSADSFLTSLSYGDFLVGCASLLYSLHVVRLSDVAGDVDPLDLAREKAKVRT